MALNFIIKIKIKDIFSTYSKLWKKKKLVQPPKNTITTRLENKMTDKYSDKKNRANLIAEYSTLYPETNSGSASGKSKGCLLVSAAPIITKNISWAGIK